MLKIFWQIVTVLVGTESIRDKQYIGRVPLPTGERSGRGLCPLPSKFFDFFEHKKASFGASLVLFFAVHLSEFTYSDS